MTQSILVFGASGNVGTEVVKRLVSRGYKVKAATRTGKAVNGAEGVSFDFQDSETLQDIFEDIDATYILLPAGYSDQYELLEPVIEQAIASNTKVVFQSAIGVDADDQIPYRKVELLLENSANPYVILRPNWFADNFHTFWKTGVVNGEIALPAAEAATSFIDVRDIAESAINALTRDDFNNKAFNLTGSEAFTYQQAAELLSEVLNKQVTYKAIDDESLVSGLVTAGISNEYAQFIAAIFHPVRQGWTAAVSDDVQVLTGTSARSLNDYIKDNSAKLVS